MNRVLAITGTSTDVGKTVVTAALAAAASRAGRGVGVCKPVQTGIGPGADGDLAEVVRLSGVSTVVECARYPEPLAPETAARRADLPFVELTAITRAVTDLRDRHDLTLVEGAGGVLVRLAEDLTLLDVAEAVDAAMLVVIDPGLGALNHAELTVGAIRARGVRVAGLVIGSWPAQPDLAMRCNERDLPRLTGVPVVGTLPARAGALERRNFCDAATDWFDPEWLSRELIPSVPVSEGASL